MKKLSLKERKEILKKEWEECFEMSIEKKLSEKGLKVFWDDKTSEDEAAKLLTVAAIDLLFDDIADEIMCCIIAGKKKKCDDIPFTVVRKPDRHYFNETFETKEQALEFAKKQAMNSMFTLDDFEIIKAYN